MLVFKRKDFKQEEPYPEIHYIYNLIKAKHKIANHTEKNLLQNKHILNFCEEATHFWDLDHKIFLSYNVASWFKEPAGAQVTIESITVYDDFMEYESARLKGLHGAKQADIPNLN